MLNNNKGKTIVDFAKTVQKSDSPDQLNVDLKQDIDINVQQKDVDAVKNDQITGVKNDPSAMGK